MYSLEVIIEAKPGLKDPEGTTICHDLLQRHGFEDVKSVRSAKLLRLEVEATSAGQAKEKVLKACNELRLFNPISHTCSIKISSERS